jgi:acetyl esterase/lipase
MSNLHRYCLRAIVPLVAALGLSAQEKAPKGPMQYSRPPDLANVPYGPDERNVLDLWKAKSDRPAPLVLYFHPGGFNHGDKTWIEWLDKPMLELCLERGISVATANYRFCPKVRLPAPMLDGARALQYLRLHAKEYNLNPQAVALAGGSSGAIMSMWIGFHDDLADPKANDPVKRQSTRVPVIGTIDGQCTLDPRVIAKLIGPEMAKLSVFRVLYAIEGDPLTDAKAFPHYEESAAITYLTKDDPPVFMFYTHNLAPLPVKDQNEGIHNPRFGVMLKERMDKLGIEAILRLPKDYPGGERRPFTKDMVDFFQKYWARQAGR